MKTRKQVGQKDCDVAVAIFLAHCLIPARVVKCLQCLPSHFSPFVVGNLSPLFTCSSLQGEVWSEVYHGARRRLTRDPLVALSIQLSQQPHLHERPAQGAGPQGKEGWHQP